MASPAISIRRYFCQTAWFNKEQHKKLHNHKNKWVTSKSGDHLHDPVSRELFRATSAAQVRRILSDKLLNHEWITASAESDAHVYIIGLRKLIDLQEFEECWSLFEHIKGDERLWHVLCAPIFNTMIYLCVQRRTKFALKQALELYTEMTELHSLSPDLATFTNLISLCSAVAAWDKADAFWRRCRARARARTRLCSA